MDGPTCRCWRRMGVLFRTGTGAVCCCLFVLQPLINIYTGGEWEQFAVLFFVLQPLINTYTGGEYGLFAALFLSFTCDKHLHWRRMGMLFRTGKDIVCCTLLVFQTVINTHTGGEWESCLLHSFCPSACDKHLHWRRMGVVCCTLFVLQLVCCSEQVQALFAAHFWSFKQ